MSVPIFYQKSIKCKPSGRPAYNDLETKSVWSDGGEDINNGRLELHLKSKYRLHTICHSIHTSLDTQVRAPCFCCSRSVQFNLLVWLYLFYNSSINSYLLFIYTPYYLYRYAYLSQYDLFSDSASVLIDYWDITTFSRGTPSFQQEKPSQHL